MIKKKRNSSLYSYNCINAASEKSFYVTKRTITQFPINKVARL